MIDILFICCIRYCWGASNVESWHDKFFFQKTININFPSFFILKTFVGYCIYPKLSDKISCCPSEHYSDNFGIPKYWIPIGTSSISTVALVDWAFLRRAAHQRIFHALRGFLQRYVTIFSRHFYFETACLLPDMALDWWWHKICHHMSLSGLRRDVFRPSGARRGTWKKNASRWVGLRVLRMYSCELELLGNLSREGQPNGTGKDRASGAELSSLQAGTRVGMAD